MGTIQIPGNQLDTGLQLCGKNIRCFVRDAEILLQDSSSWHAIALAIFAFEELGKYSELRRAKAEMIGDTVPVDDRLFYDHRHKQELARKLIPQDALILVPAYFDLQYFDTECFQTEDVEVSPTLRLDCVFVNWKDGKWVHGSDIETDRIKKFTQAILDALNSLESTPNESSSAFTPAR